MKSINIQRAGKSAQSGFTIIELVVVILLLGILAATALPRFINVTDEAHGAVVDAVLGGITTGGALFRAEFIGQGGTNTTVGNFSILASSGGYPLVTSSATCADAYNALLQGGRPTVAVGAGSPGNSAAKANRIGSEDLVAEYSSSDTSCIFSYTADVTNIGSAATKAVVWNPVTGESLRN